MLWNFWSIEELISEKHLAASKRTRTKSPWNRADLKISEDH